nr:uncharacterized protein LOC128701883 [Cherax quadricarinatus]
MERCKWQHSMLPSPESSAPTSWAYISVIFIMRLTPVSLASVYYINNVRPKNGRRPTRRPFPFTNELPIFLRDHVSGKNDKQQRSMP